MRVLITGGCGFVGRAFVKHYLDAGAEVHCVDNLVSESAQDPRQWINWAAPDIFTKFHYWEMDCRTWFGYFGTDTHFDYVLHLAALVGGRLKIENQPIAIADDLSIDAAFWQWAVKARPAKVAVFSSSAVYPVYLQSKDYHVPLQETMCRFGDVLRVGVPDMTYGWAKLTSEYLAQVAYQKHGIKSVIYRPFSGYGEGQHEAYPFPALMRRVWEQTDVEVWGSGKQVRDFIHIDDIVRAVVQTIDRIDDARALNLSSGRGVSFYELVEMAAAVLDVGRLVRPDTSKPEGVFWRVGSVERQWAYDVQHRVSLKDGVERYMAWLLSQPR